MRGNRLFAHILVAGLLTLASCADLDGPTTLEPRPRGNPTDGRGPKTGW